MKKLSFLIASLFVGTMSYAQISIDPEVGVNFSNIKTKVDGKDATTSDAKAGFRAGVGVNIDVYKGLYLRPGIYYNQLGGKEEVAGIESKLNLHYLEVPVNIGYKYTISEKAGGIFAEAGPYIGLAIAGQTKTEILGNEVKNDVAFGDKLNETNPLDWGFKFGLGYESPWGVYVKGNYGLSLGNLSNADNVTITNNNWNISLGYRIKF